MTQLFDANGYTNSGYFWGKPGAKVGGTSQDAADAIHNRAATLRQAVIAMFRKHGSLTADEVAELLGESVLAIRPRLSELRKLGRIADTGLRRKNQSGRSANVWRME